MTFRKNSATLAATLLLAVPACAHPFSGLHWIKIHVYHAKPSQVFSRLGLTHITRYGHTLGQRHIPDPTFPPGLTDVVPFNPTHTLLARGTTQGLKDFQQRVAAADVPVSRWQLSLTLIQSHANGTTTVLAAQTVVAEDNKPCLVSFPTPAGTREYALTLHDNRDGTLTLSRRIALSLPAPAVPAATTPLFVPAQIWTRSAAQSVSVGQTQSFSDLAADRAAARQQIGQADPDSEGNFQVQVLVTNCLAPPTPALAPTGAPTP